MKRLQSVVAFLLAVLMLASLAACGTKTDPDVTEPTTSDERAYKTPIAVPDGVLNLGIAKLRSDRSYAFDVKTYATAEETAEQLRSGAASIAVLPPALALQLYEETDGAVQMLAVTTQSVFYAVENGGTVKTVEDLKGKTVVATGEQTDDGKMLRALLQMQGLDPEKDLTIQYLETQDALTEAALSGEEGIWLMSEPYAGRACVESDALRIALDLNVLPEEAPTPAQGCLAVRKDYIQAHPAELEEFLTYYEVSVNFVQYNLQTAAAVFAGNGYFSSAESALAALPRMNIVFLTGAQMREAADATFTILRGADALPPDAFYYGI
ncbi:MAG: ABC transporter substrate-binding protein [Clostridia bacterium]|nr:ABC transporter substrate-binding protein [Clostridia bacterium]